MVKGWAPRLKQTKLWILPHSGSILDSGKFQLARWSHEVAVLCSWDHPPTPPHQLETRSFPFNAVRCPHPNCSPIKKVCAISPPPKCRGGFVHRPPIQYTLFLCSAPPVYIFLCGVPPLYFFALDTLGYVLDSKQCWESVKFQLARWSHRLALFVCYLAPVFIYMKISISISYVYLSKTIYDSHLWKVLRNLCFDMIKHFLQLCHQEICSI